MKVKGGLKVFLNGLKEEDPHCKFLELYPRKKSMKSRSEGREGRRFCCP